MKLRKTALLLLTALLAVVVLLSACGAEKAETITAENVKEKMAVLMPECEKYTAYLTLGTLEPQEYDYETAYTDANGCKYVPVADAAFNTVAKLKAAAEQYFTAEYAAKNLFEFAFEGKYPIYKEVDGVMNVNVDSGGGGAFSYVAGTSELVSQADGVATVKMEARDSYDGAYTAAVTLKLVDGIYKIDGIEQTEAA